MRPPFAQQRRDVEGPGQVKGAVEVRGVQWGGEVIPLSPRESAIAACVIDAMTDKEIAKAIPMHQKSVELSIQRIKLKIGGARNRVELAMKLKELSR